MSPECPLTELPPDQCACRNHRGGDAPGDEPIATIGQAFTAAYSTRCARHCGRGIEPGDEIIRCWEAADGYVHAGRCP